MYPNMPESDADLVPLPRCDGPKLKPFKFNGPQKIKFLDLAGEGSHSYVFKVEIQGKVYALKLFRFVNDDDWDWPEKIEPGDGYICDDPHVMSIFADYSEPFYCECRAYGRLKETGREDLTIKSFGYIFLNEEHERIMMEQFANHHLCFSGSMDNEMTDEDGRCRFLGKDDKAPPIRGIVKELGQGTENLTTPLAKSLLKDIKEFQRLGIVNLDVAFRQVINGKLSDFSQTITIPHYRTNPELNPNPFPPKLKYLMWLDLFVLSSCDYWDFDDMVKEWNRDNNGNIKVHAFPGGSGCHPKHQYNLRKKLMYTFVDPRKLEGVKKQRKRRMWVIKPDNYTMWYLSRASKSTRLGWGLRDGYIFPTDDR